MLADVEPALTQEQLVRSSRFVAETRAIGPPQPR
jgi:hypothetical protein